MNENSNQSAEQNQKSTGGIAARQERISTTLSPRGTMEILSRNEVNRLCDTSQGGLHPLFRSCALAVLNSGSDTDDGARLLARHRDFSIELIQQQRGIKLKLNNAPGSAFVDGELIRGIQEHLFSVLRDIVFVHSKTDESVLRGEAPSPEITNAIFHILRNARLLRSHSRGALVVCWGGHSIGRQEYEYTKEVGHELGLRRLNIVTGCGPGAMKGPMKGATIGHSKQRIYNGRYIGITEPGIIAAESPNPIVNELTILPDIEKRLESFIRLGHGVIVFPGGAGTAEEILYLLGILLHPENRDIPLPLIFTGPRSAEGYFRRIHQFIDATLGFEAQQRYKIIIDDPAVVAREMAKGLDAVHDFRQAHGDADYFNWLLHIEHDFQRPFMPTHEAMSSLALHRDQPPHQLAAQLRRAFSGIVAGNVKADGIEAIREHGPYEISGSREIMTPLDDLLRAFVEQGRMKLNVEEYKPCYRLTGQS
jgi:predicted Rossmann-fold nucleotide-binding protein